MNAPNDYDFTKEHPIHGNPEDHGSILIHTDGSDVYCNRNDIRIIYKFEGVKNKRFLKREVTRDGHLEGTPHEVSVENNTPIIQKSSTDSYSEAVTETKEVKISKTVGASVSVGFNAFGADVSISGSYEHGNEHTSSNSKQVTVTAPSQEVLVSPCSKGKLVYHFYKSTVVNKYLLDYVIDYKKTKLKCKGVEYPFASNPNIENNLHRGDPELQEVFSHDNGGEYILKNVPATETLTIYDGKSQYEFEENVPNYEQCMKKKN